MRPVNPCKFTGRIVMARTIDGSLAIRHTLRRDQAYLRTTTLCGVPAMPLLMLSMSMWNKRVIASWLPQAMCGVTIKCGKWVLTKGLPSVGGSLVITSKPMAMTPWPNTLSC